MDLRASTFSPSATAAPPSTSSQHPPIQPPSIDDLFSVFGLPPLDAADARSADLQKHTSGVPPNTVASQSGFVNMPPPTRTDAPKFDTPAAHPSAMPNIEALSLNKHFTYGRPGPHAKRSIPQAFPLRRFPPPGAAPTKPFHQITDSTLPPSASEGERQISNQSQGHCAGYNLTPDAVLPFEAMAGLLSKLDTKYTQAAPYLTALEKLVDAKVNAMPKADPKRKLLMQQFFELKRAHSQVQIGALQMRANLVAEAREERKQKAAAQDGKDQMELE